MARRKALREEKKAAGEVPGEENPLIVRLRVCLLEIQLTHHQIWTSARRRAHHTAWPFVHSGYKVEQKAIMSEINP